MAVYPPAGCSLTQLQRRDPDDPDAAGEILLPRLAVADSRKARRRGLLDAGAPPMNGGLLLPGEPVVHMTGMNCALDLVFLSRHGHILRIKENVKPGWMLHGHPFARATLELRSGRARELGLATGQKLSWR